MLVLGILIGVFIPFTNPFRRSFTKILHDSLSGGSGVA
ncbi:MAG: hypothetical protein ACLVHV_02595 [Oscillospiraceae bacterium]